MFNYSLVQYYVLGEKYYEYIGITFKKQPVVFTYNLSIFFLKSFILEKEKNT